MGPQNQDQNQQPINNPELPPQAQPSYQPTLAQPQYPPTAPTYVPLDGSGMMVSPPKRSFGQKLGHIFRRKAFWFSLVGLLVAVVVGAWFVQPARWWIVNTLGLQNDVTITTIMPSKGEAKPSQLKRVTVIINGKSYTTDDKGTLTLHDVPYGQILVQAKKTGFSEVKTGVTLDFDPFFHLFGGKQADQSVRSLSLSLSAVGLPVSFMVTDWLSGAPVTTGEFSVGDITATPDTAGLVSMSIPGVDAKTVSVSAKMGGSYVDKKFEVPLGATSASGVALVPAGKHYFLSKRDGMLNVYRSNIDGTDVDQVIAGTGQETDETAFAASPDGKYGVLVSSRDGQRDAKQNVLQRVYVVDTATKQLTRVDQAVHASLADWSGDVLAYTISTYDSTTNSYPVTLRSIDTTANRVYNFETAKSISIDSVGLDKVVYQKVSDIGTDAADSPILRKASVNGTNIQTLGKQVKSDFYWQLDFDRVAFRTDQDQAWHEYNFNTDKSSTISQPNAGNSTQQFIGAASSDGNKRLFVDQVDGTSTLMFKNTASGEQKTLYGGKGLAGPIRWINNTVVSYRVVNGVQTSDFVVSINGGDPQKVADVTSTTPSDTFGASQRFRFY